MVGVAGKSKGCRTCRQRKIKCGKQRPGCLQCTRSHRQCPGYQTERLFIQVNPEKKNHDPISGTALIQTSYRQHIVDEFNNHCIPTEDGKKRDSWLTQLLSIPFQTSVLESARLALCTALVGHKNNSPPLLHQSLKLYTRGLRELQAAVMSPKLARHDETLAACLALTMYELAECPAKHIIAYQQHCKGLLSLIKLRGANAHASGLGHQMFLAVRLQGILYDLGQLSPSFMEDDAWVTIPWRNSAKRPIDKLIDCIAHIPRIFYYLHTYPSLTSEQQEHVLLKVITEFNNLNTTLCNIYKELNDSIEGPLYWSVLAQNDSNDPLKGPLFPIAFCFPDLSTAGALMMYWATCTLLWSGFAEFMKAARHPDPLLDISLMIINVCQSAEFCLQEKNLVIGSYVASTPLAMCLAVLNNKPDHAHQATWIRKTMEKLQNRGLRILKYQ